MKKFTSKNQQIGQVGEDLAVKFLVKQGFSLLERNYTLKIGEIDIVATKAQKLHFIEVKTLQKDLSVTRETLQQTQGKPLQQTQDKQSSSAPQKVKDELFRPEDNVSREKLRRFSSTVLEYLDHKGVPHETDWQIDVVTVLLDLVNKQAKVEILSNVIVEQ